MKCSTDPSIYLRVRDNEYAYLLEYVADVLLLGSSEKGIQETGKVISSRFQVRIEPTVSKLLRLVFEMTADSVLIHSTTADRRILNHFNMEKRRPASMPLPCGMVLDYTMTVKTAFEKEEMGQFPCRDLVGSLMYLSNTTRPDISYVVGLLAPYAERPVKAHGNAGKHVLRYFGGTISCGMEYSSINGNPDRDRLGHSDADFGGAREKSKSTTGWVLFISGGAVYWWSEKQSHTA